MQKVGSKATSPSSIFARDLALRIAATKDEAYGVPNKMTNTPLHFLISQSDAETYPATWSFTDTEHGTNHLESEINRVTSNDQKQFNKEFSIFLIKFESWWETLSIQALRKPLPDT